MSKIYCGYNRPAPPGFRYGTDLECEERGQLRRYGRHLYDPAPKKYKIIRRQPKIPIHRTPQIMKPVMHIPAKITRTPQIMEPVMHTPVQFNVGPYKAPTKAPRVKVNPNRLIVRLADIRNQLQRYQHQIDLVNKNINYAKKEEGDLIYLISNINRNQPMEQIPIPALTFRPTEPIPFDPLEQLEQRPTSQVSIPIIPMSSVPLTRGNLMARLSYLKSIIKRLKNQGDFDNQLPNVIQEMNGVIELLKTAEESEDEDIIELQKENSKEIAKELKKLTTNKKALTRLEKRQPKPTDQIIKKQIHIEKIENNLIDLGYIFPR